MSKKKRPVADNSPNLAPFLIKTKENIEQFGHGIISVMEGPDEPGFSYTVGRIEKGLPELIIFGVSAKTGMNILNDAVKWAEKAKGVFPENTPIEGILNFPTVIKPVQPQHISTYFRVVEALYPGAEFRGLQMIWPDTQSRFPWESGFDTSLSKHQRILYASA